MSNIMVILDSDDDACAIVTEQQAEFLNSVEGFSDAFRAVEVPADLRLLDRNTLGEWFFTSSWDAIRDEMNFKQNG